MTVANACHLYLVQNSESISLLISFSCVGNVRYPIGIDVFKWITSAMNAKNGFESPLCTDASQMETTFVKTASYKMLRLFLKPGNISPSQQDDINNLYLYWNC